MSTKPSPFDGLFSTIRATCEAAAIGAFQAGAKELRKRVKKIDRTLENAETDDTGAKLISIAKPAVRKALKR